MKTIRARINELERVLRGHQEDAEAKLAIGRTRRATETIRATSGSLAALTAAVGELNRSGVALDTPPVLATLPDVISAARDEARRDGLAPGRGDEPPIVRILESLVIGLRDQVNSAWTALKLEKQAPVIDEELLELAAESDPSLLEQYERTRTVLTLLVERREPKEGDIERWSSCVDALREIASRAAELAPSEEVRNFLAAASSREGASLAQVDVPAVREWLSEGERATRFRVRAQGG